MEANVIKNGKNSKGVQRFYNKDTKKYSLEKTFRPPTSVKLLAAYLYISGLSLRKVGETLGFHNTTILRWVDEYSQIFDYKQTVDKNVVYEDVEIDELFTYLIKKKLNSISG